jgi:hypothetical protein
MNADVEAWLRESLSSEAQARSALHQSQTSNRPLSEASELIGLIGEFEFGRVTGRMPDLEHRPNGDGGFDFVVSLRFTVDVKTAERPFNLIHEQGKPFADIYVLAQYVPDSQRAPLLGWEWGANLRAAPVRDFGHGVFNHYIPRERLRPMAELLKRMRAP